jgi:ABC-type thiamin/hydroxymethylpyrimidine transport system permease subunit
MYNAVNVACIGFFLGERRDQFNPLKHLVVPVLGVIAMVLGFFSAFGGVTIPIINLELPPLPEPYNYAPILVGIWLAIGVVLYFVLRQRSPEAIGQLGAAVSES